MKAVIGYMIMVGLPIIGIFALLQIGEQLTAPISVGGNWQLEAESATYEQTSCWQLLTWPPQPGLNISQSGLYLQITLNDADLATLSGELTDTTITASTSNKTTINTRNKEADDAPEEYYLQMIVDPQSEPERLTGTLSGNTCVSTAISGVRQPIETTITGDQDH